MTQQAQNNNDKQGLAALKLHANKIITVILVVLAIFFGWQYYQKNFGKVDTVASDSFILINNQDNQLMQQIQNAQTENANNPELKKHKDELYANIDALVDAHPKSVYAWQALMVKSRYQTQDNEFKNAIETLKQASKIHVDEGLAALTKIRLGQVLLADNQLDEAFTQAQENLPKAFEASRQELLGDVYVAKNDAESAKTAYLAAWENLRERQEVRSLLFLKLQSLGVTPQAIEVEEIFIQPDESVQNQN